MTCTDLEGGGKGRRDPLKKKKRNIKFTLYDSKITENRPQTPLPPGKHNFSDPLTKQKFFSESMHEMCYHYCTDLTCWLH